jgi:hypothetical protein
VLEAQNQSLKNLYEYCLIPKWGDTLTGKETYLRFIKEKTQTKIYLLSCDSVTSLYAQKIKKIEVTTSLKNIAGFTTIHFAFDSSFHQMLEKDLGLPNFRVWSAYRSDIDSDNIIYDRGWSLQDYTVIFSCTRYSMVQNGQNDDILLQIGPKVKPE